MNKEYNIDATGKRPGRLATEISKILSGKNIVTYAPNKVPAAKVTITNAAKMDIDKRKKTGKTYQTYSGYPGGQKTFTMRELIEKKGYSEVLRKAVYGMLASNKLRQKKMNRLTIQE